jgi:outer membrane protein TolC
MKRLCLFSIAAVIFVHLLFIPVHGEEIRILNLRQVIDIAIENNPDISVSSWNVKASEARKDQAHSQTLPNLSLTGGYGHYLNNQRLVPLRYQGEQGILL